MMSLQIRRARQCIASIAATIPMKRKVVSLEDECYWYIIRNLHEFPAEMLSLLPKVLRYRLLLNLPVVDICQLEDTSVITGIDADELWRNLCSQRSISVEDDCFHSCGIWGISSRDIFFQAVWNMLFYNMPYFKCGISAVEYAERMYHKYVNMLFSVSNPLNVGLTDQHYHFSSLVPHQFRLDRDMLSLFEFCNFRPKYLCIDTMETGSRLKLKQIQIQADSTPLEQFMSNLQVLCVKIGERDSREPVRGFIQVTRVFLRSVTRSCRTTFHTLKVDLSLTEFYMNSDMLTDEILPTLAVELQTLPSSIKFFSLKAPDTVGFNSNVSNVQAFFDAVFSLPQLTTLELGVSCIPQHIDLLYTSWKRLRQERKLTRLTCALDVKRIKSDMSYYSCWSLLSEMSSHSSLL